MVLFWGSRKNIDTPFNSTAFQDDKLFNQDFERLEDIRMSCVYFLLLNGKIMRVGKARVLAERLDMYFGNRPCCIDAVAITRIRQEKDRRGIENFFIEHFSPPYNYHYGSVIQKPKTKIKIEYVNLDTVLECDFHLNNYIEGSVCP